MTTTATLDGFAISPVQRRSWSLAPRLARCTVEISTVELRGALDPARLEAALREVVDTHEILRTAFKVLPGMTEPLMVVADDGEVRLERDETGPIAHELDAMPVLRARLQAAGQGVWRLELALPALAADRATLDLLVAELARVYAEQTRDDEPMQLIDLATWQNELLESPEAAAARALYRPEIWAERALELPFARSGRETGRLGCTAGISAARLDTVAQELGTSAEIVALSAWLAVLARSTGARRPVVGVLHDGRKFDELKTALGPFAKRLPLAVELGEESFAARVAKTAEAWRALEEWEEYFELATLATLAGDDPAQASFPVGFSWDAVPPALEAGGLRWRILERDAETEPCALELRVERRGDALRLALDGPAALLSAYRALLAGALENPQSTLSELPLATPAQRFQQLVEWNDTALASTLGGVLPRLLSARAAQTPGHPAVVFGEQVLSYAELEERAGRLANHLLALGVGRGDVVGVCLERSVEMVVTLLAVLETGAAYLPLSPDDPAERRERLLAEAGTSWLLTAELLERDREAIARRPAALPADIGPSADDLAYVIYTSGSTGHPKGVMISHGAIGNRLLWMQHAHPLGAADRVLQKTPYNFDASVWEIFCPLLAGATVVVARPGGHQDPDYLCQAIAEHGVSVLQLVPSALRLLLESRYLEACTSLRRLFCGGEALPAALVERLRERVAVEVINLYGPTEVSIDASSWPVPPVVAETILPIGRPLANLRLHLLDARWRLAAPGLAGELCVGGPSLARGYLGRPAASAERFVPDAFSARPGERLYRTGDLARHRAGGELEFLGRRDHQVKVRGFRIELGEIESALAAVPGVREAAVVSFEASPGDVRLKACVAMEAASFRVEELIEALGQRLPEHMVPSAFVRLDQLPRLAASAKLDRKLLATLEPETRVSGGDTAPRSLVRDLLAEMWCDVLGLAALGAHANVFEHGAHSLLVTQVVLRIQKTFGVELPLRAIFEAPTVAELASQIEAALGSGSALAGPPIAPVSRERPLPLSFAQQRLWFLDQLDPGSTAYCTPEAFRLTGQLDLGLIDAAWAAMIERHETLRTVFPTVGREPVQQILPPRPILIPRIDLGALRPEHRESAVSTLSAPSRQAPFDLAHGPLLRVVVLRLAKEEHVVLVTLHHIVSDAWSGAIVGRELAALYTAGAAGKPAQLPPLAVQYADYSVWQRGQLEAEALAKHMDYWKRQLGDAPVVLELPIDKARPAVLSSRGDVRRHALPAALTARLKAVARARSSSLYMVLMAAYQVWLHQQSGARDFLVGTTIANRERPETENLIGFFVNLLALRCRLEGLSTFDQLLAKVRATALEAYSHQALPIDRLIQELGIKRDPSRSTLCQAVFTFENVPGRTVESAAGITLSQIPIHEDTAVFDLALIMTEEKDGVLDASFRYMSDLYRPATIDGFLKQLEWVFEQVAERPEIALDELVEGLSELARRRAADVEKELAEASIHKLAARMRTRRNTTGGNAN